MRSQTGEKNVMLPVVMISLALALRQMSMTIVAPFISTYCKSLIGYTPLLAGLAVGAFGLMQALFQIPFGILSDRYGNKRLMLGGLALVVAGLVLAFFAKSIGLLIFARALQGSGAIIGIGYSWVAGLAQGEERTKAMSILGAFISAAAALAFAAGPFLRRFMAVNLMFLAGAVLLSANTAYILFFLKDAGGGGERAVPKPGEIRLLLKNKTFVIMNLAAFFNNFVMMSVFFAAPIYMDSVTGQNGMWEIFVPAVAIAVVFMKFAVKLVNRISINPVLSACFLLCAFSILFYFRPSSFLFLLAGTTLYMCGYVTIATVVATHVNNIVDDALRGTGNGIFNSFQYIGNFAGAFITGAVWGISQGASWLVLMGTGLAGFLLVVLGKPEGRAAQAQEA